MSGVGGNYLFDDLYDDLDGFSSFVEKLHYELRTGQTSATDLVKNGWEIAKQDESKPDSERLNALVYGQQREIIETAAQEHAHNSDIRYKVQRPRGLLDGIPITVKDIATLHVKNCETTNGSFFGDPPQAESAIPVRLMREAGSVVIGRTTTPEYGYKGTTNSKRFGITRNPACPWLTSGGSSGGAVATVGNGMVPVALGSDGGGSIRIPAACTGLFGFKPSFGVVSNSRNLSTLSHAGPLTRTVRDAAIVMDTIQHVRDEEHDAATIGVPHDFEFLAQCDTQLKENSVSELRVAVSLDLGHSARGVDPQVVALIRRAVEEIVRPLVKSVDYVDDELAKIVSKDHNRQFGVLWLARAAANKHFNSLKPKDFERLDPGLVTSAKLGKAITGIQVQNANTYCLQLKHDMIDFHRKYDILISPTIPTLPVTANDVYGDVHDIKRGNGGILKNVPKWSPSMFTSIFNVTQQPASSINCGFAKSDPNSPGKGARVVPVGMQIAGGLYKDDLVMKMSYAVEQAMLKAQHGAVSKL